MSKVLIVNDDKDLVETSCLVLESAGFEVVHTLEGKATVAIAHEQRPDVILLDFVLSGTNGGTVMAALRSDLTLRTTPVVMMSALQDGAERARRAGADFFLQKPFTAGELVDAVTQRLRPE